MTCWLTTDDSKSDEGRAKRTGFYISDSNSQMTGVDVAELKAKTATSIAVSWR